MQHPSDADRAPRDAHGLGAGAQHCDPCLLGAGVAWFMRVRRDDSGPEVGLGCELGARADAAPNACAVRKTPNRARAAFSCRLHVADARHNRSCVGRERHAPQARAAERRREVGFELVAVNSCSATSRCVYGSRPRLRLTTTDAAPSQCATNGRSQSATGGRWPGRHSLVSAIALSRSLRVGMRASEHGRRAAGDVS
jgi:hypothetical protein